MRVFCLLKYFPCHAVRKIICRHLFWISLQIIDYNPNEAELRKKIYLPPKMLITPTFKRINYERDIEERQKRIAVISYRRRLIACVEQDDDLS